MISCSRDENIKSCKRWQLSLKTLIKIKIHCTIRNLRPLHLPMLPTLPLLANPSDEKPLSTVISKWNINQQYVLLKVGSFCCYWPHVKILPHPKKLAAPATAWTSIFHRELFLGYPLILGDSGGSKCSKWINPSYHFSKHLTKWLETFNSFISFQKFWRRDLQISGEKYGCIYILFLKVHSWPFQNSNRFIQFGECTICNSASSFWDPDISLLCSKIGCTIPEMWLLHENAARVSNSISHAHHQDAQCVASQWSGLKRRGALVKSQDPPRPMYQWPVLWMSSCIDVYKWHC